MDHPDEPFFPRSDFAFASPGVPQKEQRVRYTYTGLELPSPFGGRSPLCSKREAPFEKGGPHYVASPMPGFSPGIGKVGMSPFAEFASGLPTLCTPGLVKDGVMPSPIMREVMLHQYTEVSPMSKDRPQVKKFSLPAPKQNIDEMRQPMQCELQNSAGQHYDPFADGDAKPHANPEQPTEVPVHPNHQDPNASFDSGNTGRRGRGVTEGGAPREQKPCSCKKSRCLKKYCECYAGGKYCEGCYCTLILRLFFCKRRVRFFFHFQRNLDRAFLYGLDLCAMAPGGVTHRSLWLDPNSL